MTVTQYAGVARHYAVGEGTADIAQALGLGVTEVIGVVRGPGLRPPAMVGTAPGVAAALQAPVPAGLPPCSPLPVASVARPAPAPARRNGQGVPVAARADDDTGDLGGDDDGPARRKGCPKGWLMAEAQAGALYRRAPGRFQDVVFEPRAAIPVARPRRVAA